MIELHNFIRVKSIAERKRNSIKGCTPAAHKAKPDTFVQSRAVSPEALMLGDSSGATWQKHWARTSHQHKREWAGIGPMYSKLAHHIIGLNSKLIRPRTVNTEQHFISIKRRYVTGQNPHRSEIQQVRYHHSAAICTRDPGMLC